MQFNDFRERLAWEVTREKKLKLIKKMQSKYGDVLFKRHLKQIVKAVKNRIEG